MVVTIAKEVKDGKGVIGINLNLDNILKISKMINIGEKGYAVILDQNKQIVSHPSRKPGAKVTDPWIKPIYEDKQRNVAYTEKDDKKNLIFATNEKTGWKVVGVMFDEEITQAANPVFIRLYCHCYRYCIWQCINLFHHKVYYKTIKKNSWLGI